jgi:HTH-type transcriptional regulator/antitoxin HigA
MLKPIHTEQGYNEAMGTLATLWRAAPGSDEAAQLEILGTLIDIYERAQIKPATLNPVEVIKAEMEMNGRTRADLAALIGQSRATEILARARPLTLPMIRAISEAWEIPAGLLVADYKTEAPKRERRNGMFVARMSARKSKAKKVA